jgi:hypothetical protein
MPAYFMLAYGLKLGSLPSQSFVFILNLPVPSLHHVAISFAKNPSDDDHEWQKYVEALLYLI